MNSLVGKLLHIFSISLLVICTHITNVSAEQIEIYNGTTPMANVLFVIDTSGSMNDPVGAQTRMDVVKNAFATVLSRPYQNLNVGVMDFSEFTASGVDLPVVDINQLSRNVEPGVTSTTETYDELLTRVVNAYAPRNGARTPTVEALYEAALYFRGQEPFEGDQNTPHTSWDDDRNNDGNVNDPAYVPGHFTSAGLRTFENGTIQTQNGGFCLNEATTFSGANHGLCGSRVINPSTCENYTDQRCSTGSFVCNGGTNSDGVCVGGFSCTGTLIDEIHNRCRLIVERLVNSNYVSPITSSCDKNYIVLLSDGLPTVNNSGTQTRIRQLYNPTLPSCDNLNASFSSSTITNFGRCGPDLTRYLNQNDQMLAINDSYITTHTIGFALGGSEVEARQYLELLANEGGGQFFDASANPGDLANQLESLLNSLSVRPSTISTPLATIDLGNPLVNRPEAYYALFEPANSPRWAGNVKGYFNIPDASTPELGDTAVVGLDLNPALDANGDFTASSRSFWSSSSDGGSVTIGGFAGTLTNPATRTIFTDGGTTNRALEISLSTSNFDETDVGLFNLTPSGNAATDRTNVHDLVNWARGVDVDDADADPTTTERLAIGDVLNSVPVIANYSSGPSRVMYFTTNEGFLHAVDVSDPTIDLNTNTVTGSGSGGDELFAYIPSDLLSNLEPLRRNVVGNAKIYGLDGDIALDQVGGALNSAGDKYLYAGMRRGGKNYYSLDVSNVSLPSMRWVIEGGVGAFSELAQTWSRPSPARIDIGGTPRDVIIFGGGYDVDQDANSVRTADDEGRAVFIVDAATGNKLWSAGPDATHDLNLGLQNSVPGNIAIIDLDADSLVDRLYFGDMGGRLWRIDLDSNLSNSTGYMLADLAVDGSPTDNRRFYAEPTVSRLPNNRLGIAIGSGYRAHPLDTVIDERLYMIYDVNDTIGAPSPVPSPITDMGGSTAVIDITNNFNFDLNSTVNGWKIELNNGEKINTSVSILNNTLRLTSYVPPATTCAGDEGSSRLVTLSLSGSPITNDGVVDPSISAFENFNTVGSASSGFAEIIYRFINGDGGPPCAGTNCFPPNVSNGIEKRFWMDFDTSSF